MSRTLKQLSHRFCVKPPFPARFVTVFEPVSTPFLDRFFTLT